MATSPRHWIGFAGALALLAVVAGVSVRSHAQLIETVNRVELGHRVIGQLHQLDASITQLESSRRAHAITGDDADLVNYDAAAATLEQTMATLDRLTTDPRRRTRLASVRQLVATRTDMLSKAIADRRAGGLDPARETVKTRQGATVMGQIRDAVDAMVDEETTAVATEKAEMADDVTYTRLAQLGGMTASIALLAFVFIGLRRRARERRESELAALEGERQLSTMLHSIGDGVIATDRDARVIRMNPVAERLSGWTIDDARGRAFSDVFRIVKEATGTPAPDPVSRVLADGVAVGLANHTALVARDGSERPVADSAAPIRDASGRVTGAVVVLRDASAERAWVLRNNRASKFLDSIVENIPNMLFVKDAAELRFVRFNRAGELLLGADRADLIGKSDRDLFPTDQADAFQSKDREVLAGKSIVDIPEEPIDTPSGRRWLHTRKIPIVDDDGAPAFLLGISEDVTERKQIADRMQSLNEELEQKVVERTAELRATNERLQAESAERMKATEALSRTEAQLRQSQKMEAVGRLAGGIAHDFNNVLSVIVSYSDIVAENLPPGPERSDVEEIHKAGLRAADLTRQLLAFSRQQVLAPKIVDLAAIVAGMEKLLRRVIGEDITFRAVHGPALGKVKVDPGQIEQVMMNLVVNARDAMPRGGNLTIETGNVELDEAYAADHPGVAPGRYVMVAVSDTGAGMSKETQARIFEPFFTTKDKGKGTGLGLSTVFGIVQQSGGSIWVYSEPGAGTTFKIYLPQTTETARDAVVVPGAGAVAGGSETLLLVEDEPQVRTLVRGILARAGYQVIEAADGVEAVMLCDRFSGTVHLVVTDVVMPNMSGRELVEQLAKTRPAMKVLFMSGYTDDTVVHHGVDQGVPFLQKPLTPDALIRKVREVLDGA